MSLAVVFIGSSFLFRLIYLVRIMLLAIVTISETLVAGLTLVGNDRPVAI